ncbi:SRPBCC family protein [Parapedobacter koreensis]|uniref:Uncharacterized conserved protein YndB, AHSA1/START domain n=1 Tax=Parapedobacter koreensis TaxID=332977 RepID=A0A1H7U1S6_9SPHI|nr:SRPBCC domain-containing protein [Parapedobacter koreensis]SEL90638.1 Uncharacterized conserved protein YndB, AHSA1/START domain [Parapedobacter koreensis]
MDRNNILIERLFDVPVARLWEIWTKPEFINQWFGSDPKGIVISSDIDLAVGGQYRIIFQDSDGSIHTAFGEYTEVVELEKLRYTWQWESEAGYISTVIVAFIPKAEKTLLIFEHVNLNPNSAHEYFMGWNGAMDKIVK